jgi:hypothetical protein
MAAPCEALGNLLFSPTSVWRAGALMRCGFAQALSRRCSIHRLAYFSAVIPGLDLGIHLLRETFFEAGWIARS